ncbi:MAG: hypothetical protein R3192_00585 [Woeseiaceae bacterium]|nr:hypothetical protein [Woeseiaceae bacterium]
MSEESGSLAETVATVGSKSRPRRSFYLISGLALAWNLLGVVLYVSQVRMSDAAMAALEPAERALMEAMPTWLIGVYALAVNAGALGSLLLLLRKAWAVPVLAVSLASIVVQMGYSLTMTDAVAVHGGSVVASSAVITAIGVYLVWYARRCKDNGWID